MRKVFSPEYKRRALLTVSVPLEEISYVDYPEIHVSGNERTEMPFRYVVDAKGQPIMPDVSSTAPEPLSTANASREWWISLRRTQTRVLVIFSKIGALTQKQKVNKVGALAWF